MMNRLLIIMALPIMFAFCSKPGKVNVKIKVENFKDNSAKIEIGHKAYDIKLNDAGEGIVDIDVNGETFASLVVPGIGKRQLYLVEDKNMDISVVLKERNSNVVISCDDGGINAYIDSIAKNGLIPFDYYELKEVRFMKKLDDSKEKALKELEGKSFSRKFKTMQKYNILYSYAGNVEFYMDFHSFISGDNKYRPSENIYKILESFVKEESKLFVLNSYIDFMKRGIKTVAGWNDYDAENFVKLTEASKKAAKLQSQDLKEELIYNYIKEVISASGLDGTEELLKIARANIKNLDRINAINKMVDVWSATAPGQPAPKFSFKDINGKEIALDDLKGKYVYIDCWATWCGPCCGEIPYLEKLEHDYKSKNICFVSISCDRKKSVWEKMVKEDKLGGIQLNIGNDNSFVKAYNVSGIPRFILIDKEGKIIRANAPRPSIAHIRDIFNSLKDL